MSRKEDKRAARAANIALGLRSDGRERAKQRELSRTADAERKRAKRAYYIAQGLNSLGMPRRKRDLMHPERDQRSWWLVTTQCPETVTRLISATTSWAKQRFWSGGRLHPYLGDADVQAA